MEKGWVRLSDARCLREDLIEEELFVICWELSKHLPYPMCVFSSVFVLRQGEWVFEQLGKNYQDDAIAVVLLNVYDSSLSEYWTSAPYCRVPLPSDRVIPTAWLEMDCQRFSWRLTASSYLDSDAYKHQVYLNDRVELEQWAITTQDGEGLD